MTSRNSPEDLPSGVRTLDLDECWRQLETYDVGRFAVQKGSGVDVFPVNYLVHDKAVYFRSAPGSKLIDLTRSPEVAFEIDGQLAHHMWSVIIHGVATRLGSDVEILAAGIHNLRTWYPNDKFNYVRITPSRITGRNFPKP
jgi:uncharacterized protein